jgi:predicted DNA-binding transcriptional regulator YafY/predicted nucleotidyltransferase
MAGAEPKTLRMIDLLRILLSGEAVIKKNFCRKWGIVARTFERYLLDLEDLHLRLNRESVILQGRRALKITLRRQQPPGPLVKPEAHLAFLVSKILLKNYAPGLDQKLDEVLKATRRSPMSDLDYLAIFPFSDHSEEHSSLLVNLSMAIQKRRVLEYRFSGAMRCVRPYGIFCYRTHWYVYGYEETSGGNPSNQEKTYRTDRIRDLKLSSKSFEYPENFSMKAFLEDSVGLFFNSKPCVVKVKINQKCAHYFQKRRHYPSQKIIEKLDNGGLVLQYRVNSPAEFLMFAKAWIPNMVILSPENYRSMMVEILHEAVSAYDSSSYLDLANLQEQQSQTQDVNKQEERPRGVWNPPLEIKEYINQTCAMIQEVLKRKDVQLLVYGSCVRGNSTPADIDIAINCQGKLPDKLLKKIVDKLKRSQIPYPVDLIEYQTAPNSLKSVIDSEGMAWSKGHTHKNRNW